jgi:hypothetical protein
LWPGGGELLGLVLHPELDDVALWRCEVRSNLGVTSTCGSLKKGIATPKHDIDLIKTRLKVATEHHAKEKKSQKQ